MNLRERRTSRIMIQGTYLAWVDLAVDNVGQGERLYAQDIYELCMESRSKRL